MPIDKSQNARFPRSLAATARRVNTASVALRGTGLPGFAPSGLYFGEITVVETLGPNSEQRYTAALKYGDAKTATGLVVTGARVVDDTAAALSVDDLVLVSVPTAPGPPIILGQGGSTEIGCCHPVHGFAWVLQVGV